MNAIASSSRMLALAGAWLGHIPPLAMVPAAALAIHQLPVLLPWQWLVTAVLLFGLARALLVSKHHVTARLVSRLLALLLLFAVAASYVNWRAASALADRLPRSLEGVDLQVSGRVTGLVNQFEHGRRFDFVIAHCMPARLWCQSAKRVRLSWYGGEARRAKMRAGEIWHLTIRLKRPHAPVNPGGFDAELRALQSGVSARGYVRGSTKSKPLRNPNERVSDGPPGWLDLVDRSRARVVARMNQSLASWPEPVRGTLVALVTGEQSAIPPAAWQEYNRTGTSHLMSISGLHVTLFAALTMAVMRRLLRLPFGLPPGWMNTVPAPVINVMLGATAALAYSLFSGWGIPAQRTSLMLAVAGFAVHTGRTASIGWVMAAASAAVVILDPWAPMSAGFWLSFVAVAAIVLAAQGLRARAEAGWRQAARTQWAATLSLVPLGAVWFGTFSLVSPLANLIAIPLIGALVTPLALLGAFVQSYLPQAGSALLHLIAWPTHWLLLGLGALARLPDAVLVVGQPMPLVLLTASIGVWVLLSPLRLLSPVVGAVLLVPLLVLRNAPVPAGHWRLLALDVGQGSAVLVQTASHALLFDTGPTYGRGSGAGDRIVGPALQARQVGRLDALIISHQDLDHAGGAASVMTTFDVDRLLTSMSRAHPLSVQAAHFQRCERGLRWQWDGVEFEILHPGIERVARRNRNARSCVLMVRGPGGSALLAADIEAAQERELVRINASGRLQADVLMAPHHGSNTSSTAAFLAAVQPRWAFFQMGYRNRFRHPTGKVLARYRRAGIQILRSDQHGALEWQFSLGRQPGLITHRQQRARYWRVPVP